MLQGIFHRVACPIVIGESNRPSRGSLAQQFAGRCGRVTEFKAAKTKLPELAEAMQGGAPTVAPSSDGPPTT